MNQDITSSNHPRNNPVETLNQSGFNQGELNETIAHELQEKLTEAEANLNPENITEVTALCYQVIKVDPTYDRAYKVLGNILLSQGKLAQAGRCYQTAIALNPDFAEAYANLGSIAYQQGDLDQAIADYEKALTLNPQLTGIYRNLAKVLEQQGRQEEAIALQQQALKLKTDSSSSPRTTKNISSGFPRTTKNSFLWPPPSKRHRREGDKRHRREGDKGDGRGIKQGGGEIKPDGRELASPNNQGSEDDYLKYFNQGNRLTKQGKLDQAIQCYQKALKIHPNRADAHLNLGILLRRQGQLEAAIAHYQKAIEIQPDLADAYISLGNVYFQLSEYQQARESWQQALKIQPNIGGADVQVDLGNALVYLNQIDAAIQQYEQTIQLYPDCLKAYYNLANLLCQQGNLEAAIATYRKAIELEPKFIQGYLSLGELLEQGERYDEAISTYLEILTLEFHESIAFHKLGNLLTKKGHLNDAEILYSRNIPINLFKNYAKSSKQWNFSSKDSPNNQSIYIDIYPRSFHYLSPPETIETELHYRFKESHFTCPPTSVTIVPEGRIGAADYFNKLVFDSENQLLTDISTGNLFWLSHEANMPSCEFVNQTIAYISVKALPNYYHWMADLLPRIELIRQSGIPMNSIDRFIINPTGLPIQPETLNLLGIPSEKIWVGEEPIHIKAKELIIPSLTGSIWYMSKWVCDFLRHQFLPLAQTNQAGKPFPETFPEKIYICRESKYRRIVNEPEAIAALTDRGFAIVRLESLSFLEQVALFANAKVVISAHGSGLTNIVFCQPGTKVLELFASNYIVRFYWKLSNLVQLAYYYLIFEQENSAKSLASFNPDRSHGNDEAYEDFMIHLDRLFALMKLAEV